MSDGFRPLQQDELGAQLRGFVDGAEPLIALRTGVTDVQDRVRRHRTRRRAGAATLAAAALVSAGLWGLPRSLGDAPTEQAGQTSPELVPAAAILPSPAAGRGLPRTDLLSPAALPWNSTYHWQTSDTGVGSAAPLPTGGTHACALPWFGGTGAEAEITRTYQGSSDASAQHRIVAFADNGAARHVAGELAEALRKCGWQRTRVAGGALSSPSALLLYEYVLTAGPGAPLRVTLVQSDHRVAVLVLATRHVADHAHPDPKTEHCLEEAVKSTQPHGPSLFGAEHC
ncbi:hypothetical protein ACWC5I_10200 [Kitasatospora sp. NPDC001574]